MPLRRGAVAAPFVLAVAFLAHLAGFGTSHVLGGSAGWSLLGASVAALVLLAIAAAARPLFAGRISVQAPGRPRLRDGFAGLAREVALLSFGGFAAFALLEASEGHGLPGWAPLGVVAAAALVGFAARLLFRWLTAVGTRLASLLRAERRDPRSGVRLQPAPAVSAAGRRPLGARLGRAPPVPA